MDNNFLLNATADELNVHYGLFDFGEMSDSALSSFKYLLMDCKDLKQRYISLGFHLDEFNVNQYFRDFGYDNLNDFCYDNLGLDKGAVSRCLNVWLRFSARNGNVCTMYLDEQYKDYSYTQLTEMLPLSDDNLKKITPDMTCKQIREFKKKLKGDDSGSPCPALVSFDSAVGDLSLLDDIVEFIQKKYSFPFGASFSFSGKMIRISSGGENYTLTLSHVKKDNKK